MKHERKANNVNFPAYLQSVFRVMHGKAKRYIFIPCGSEKLTPRRVLHCTDTSQYKRMHKMHARAERRTATVRCVENFCACVLVYVRSDVWYMCRRFYTSVLLLTCAPRVTVLDLLVCVCVCVCLSTFILELQAMKRHVNGILVFSAIIITLKWQP